jgi:drug/metabolite transporter superfamily protein YnfA
MTAMSTLAVLVLAAIMEVGGDAAIRLGLTQATRAWLPMGAVLLVAYGFVVNTNRAVDFGRLMGVYITVFFVVSQVVSGVVFGERPSTSLIVGGALIAAGGLLVQAGTR